MVLQGACERVIVGDLYCDIPLGLYVIRGENVVLIGEMVLMSRCYLIDCLFVGLLIPFCHIPKGLREGGASSPHDMCFRVRD